MSFHRRQLRLWAARMLFVWLFCVGVGMAHACLSTASPGHPAEHADHVSQPAMAHHAMAGESHPDAAETHCQHFCDQASVSVPTLKTTLDDVQAHAILPQGLAAALPLPVVEPLRLSLPPGNAGRAPPIPIAFLRLTL